MIDDALAWLRSLPDRGLFATAVIASLGWVGFRFHLGEQRGWRWWRVADVAVVAATAAAWLYALHARFWP